MDSEVIHSNLESAGCHYHKADFEGRKKLIARYPTGRDYRHMTESLLIGNPLNKESLLLPNMFAENRAAQRLGLPTAKWQIDLECESQMGD